jgi:transposase
MKKASVTKEVLDSPNQPIHAIQVGIDWADKEHAFCLRTPDGKLHQGSFKQKQQAIAEWISAWGSKYPGVEIQVCIEASRGALINALREYSTVRIYPVNPAALAAFRKALAHGGGKNDPVDARLILKFLEQNREHMRRLEPDSPETRELLSLVTQRRALVEQRVAHSNAIGDLWKQYFPVIHELNAAKPYMEFVIRLVVKYPSLPQLQAAGKTKLRAFFYGVNKKSIEKRLDIIMEAKPLTTDETLIRTNARQCVALARQIDTLNVTIKEYDREIDRLVAVHKDYHIFATLPGGAKNTVARIIAALGDDRTRFPNAEALQAAAGIAPITTQSGKSRYVNARWACSKFTRQTFHEYAGLSLTKCAWAKSYYDSQLAKGKTSQVAKRSLAFKWLRIIYRCWLTGKPYSDQHYMARLKATGSALAVKKE